MTRSPSSDLMRAWVRLARSEQRIRKLVESRLKQAGLPPLIWYDVLLELDRAGDAGLRQRDIEAHTLLERYNVSRLVDRLEGRGLVARHRAQDDGRGAVVTISDAGRDLRGKMWPVYSGAVEDAFRARLSANELATLAALLDRL